MSFFETIKTDYQVHLEIIKHSLDKEIDFQYEKCCSEKFLSPEYISKVIHYGDYIFNYTVRDLIHLGFVKRVELTEIDTGDFSSNLDNSKFLDGCLTYCCLVVTESNPNFKMAGRSLEVGDFYFVTNDENLVYDTNYIIEEIQEEVT